MPTLISKTYRVPRAAAFNQGAAPVIAIVNTAKTPLGYDLTAMVAALQSALDNDFAKAWPEAVGTKIKVYPSVAAIPATAWPFLFVDTADVANALGYHDLTTKGMPTSFIFVKTTIDDGGDVAVTASHELWEMLVDPGIQLWAQATPTKLYAYETADAVEETDYKVNGVRISNFVHPAYFESFRKAKSVKFDHLGLLTKPFSLLTGGYSIVMTAGKVSQVFGSKAKARRFAKENRRLHRSAERKP